MPCRYFFIITSFFFFKKTQNADKESQKFILKSFVIRNAKLYCFGFMLFRCLQASKVFTFKYAHYLRHASTVIYLLHGSLIRIIGFALRKALHTDSTLLLFISALASSIAVYIVIEFIAVRFSGKKITKLIKNAY